MTTRHLRAQFPTVVKNAAIEAGYSIDLRKNLKLEFIIQQEQKSSQRTNPH